MFSLRPTIYLVILLTFISLVTPCLAKNITQTYGNTSMEINFDKPTEITRWRITNDNVMGGVSSGMMLIENGFGMFSGNISLDNNGGFSSVYRTIEPIAEDIKKITIRVKGDGQRYQLRVIAHVDGYRVTYRHEFLTSQESLEQLTFNLADFDATFRGRILSNAPALVADQIKEVGFLITKKTPGPFTLSVATISFE
jgi:hypothetical protein